MCGRYVSPSEAAVERLWNITRNAPELFEIRYNAAPTQVLPVYRIHPERGAEIALLRWGLVPSWAKDLKMGARMINARAETLAEKPSFREAYRRRRCLVPMMGFYEWQKIAGGKVPHFIQLMNAEVFAAAGIYERWPGVGGSGPVETYSIITTAANEMMSPLHERMPVILPESAHAEWLDPANVKVEALARLLVPFPSEEMRFSPVTTPLGAPPSMPEVPAVAEQSGVPGSLDL